jgi:hypothetical protein
VFKCPVQPGFWHLGHVGRHTASPIAPKKTFIPTQSTPPTHSYSVSTACGDASTVDSDASYEARCTQAIGSTGVLEELIIVSGILIEWSRGEPKQQERNDDLIFRLRFHLPFRVKRQILLACRICSGEIGANDFFLTRWKDDLVEDKAKGAERPNLRLALTWVTEPTRVAPCGTATVWSRLNMGAMAVA